MKNKLKTLSVLAVALVASGMLCQRASAIPIIGEVDMTGRVTLNNGNLGLATAASFVNPAASVNFADGAYAGTEFDQVNWSAFGWSPATTPVNPIWTFTDATTLRTYSFNLSTLTVLTQTASFLNLTGTGTATISGTGPVYDPTQGTWTFSVTATGPHANASFGFVSSETAVGLVPDGGTTVALLGCALVGIEGLRRKLRK